jgi:hypothetical protein
MRPVWLLDRKRCLLAVVAVLAVLAVPAGALAAGAGSTAGSASGDGALAVSRASGTIYVQGRGVIYGHFDQGTLMVLKYVPDDGVSVPAVSSGKAKYSRGSGVYTGTDVRFLLPSGRYVIELIGTDVDASAVGAGSIYATGLGTFDDGSYAVNGGKPQLLTRGATDDVFGKAATTTTTTTGA